MDDKRNFNCDDVARMLEGFDNLLDELDDVVERLEVYRAGFHSIFFVNPDGLND